MAQARPTANQTFTTVDQTRPNAEESPKEAHYGQILSGTYAENWKQRRDAEMQRIEEQRRNRRPYTPIVYDTCQACGELNLLDPETALCKECRRKQMLPDEREAAEQLAKQQEEEAWKNRAKQLRDEDPTF